MIHLVVGQGRFSRQMRLPFWSILAIGGAAAVAVVLALAFLASLALIVVPACLIGAVAAQLFGRSGRGREPVFTRFRDSDPNVIEGEYRVIDDGRR
jgi:hypothetical protein